MANVNFITLFLLACDSAELVLGWGLNVESRELGSSSCVCVCERQADLLTPSGPSRQATAKIRRTLGYSLLLSVKKYIKIYITLHGSS